MSTITSADIAIREAMKAETPLLRYAAIMKTYRDNAFCEVGTDDFVRVLAAHLTLVPVPQMVTA